MISININLTNETLSIKQGRLVFIIPTSTPCAKKIIKEKNETGTITDKFIDNIFRESKITWRGYIST